MRKHAKVGKTKKRMLTRGGGGCGVIGIKEHGGYIRHIYYIRYIKERKRRVRFIECLFRRDAK